MAKGSQDRTDFEALARQYWGAWGDAMRTAMPGAAPSAGVAGAQAWHDAVDWWTQAAHGERVQVNDVVGRFNSQARQWFGQMQQVAAQFAGQDAGAADIAQAWKKALGAVGENPFPEMFRGMRGHGLGGLDQWIEDAKPYLGAFRDETAGWLGLPQFGFAREHQERAQRLAEAQIDYQQQASAYNALMLKASQSAYEIFESKLAEREEPGRQLDSPRALFDLWIDAAEEAYADIALSPEFRELYGKLVNAQMRLRGAIQREVEQVCALFGMPTRSEIDGAHRKIVELERAMRRMRDGAPSVAPAGRATPKSPPRSSGRPDQASKPDESSKKAGTRSRSAAKRAGSKTQAPAGQAGASPPGKTGAGPKAARKAATRPTVRRAPAGGLGSTVRATSVPAAPTPGKSKRKGKR